MSLNICSASCDDYRHTEESRLCHRICPTFADKKIGERKIFKHLLPNVMPQLIVSMTMGLGSIILTEATLGFLGLGAPLGTPTWGAMISAASKMEYLSGYPNFWIPPGICITLAILAFNFVGDGLRDAFDPKMKR